MTRSTRRKLRLLRWWLKIGKIIYSPWAHAEVVYKRLERDEVRNTIKSSIVPGVSYHGHNTKRTH